MALDLANHPCFSDTARHKHGRVHLPVAPRCNLQCNYCSRKFDCPNETRPGVTSNVLTPQQAMDYLDRILERDQRISVVGIAGPGDPFANADETMETLTRVRERYPEQMLCIATNGLAVSEYVDELAALAVSHITITLNAVNPAIGEKIYSWVRPGPHVLRGRAAAEYLLERQLDAVRRIKRHGITLKINSVVVPGVNDEHIPDISRLLGAMGADVQNCVALYPVEGTPFAEIEQPNAKKMFKLRLQTEPHIKQMRHCARCRADAVGMLGEAAKPEQSVLLAAAAAGALTEETRPYIAVASSEGLLVNEHLGEAEVLRIYGWDGQMLEYIGERSTPAPGSGPQRWFDLADLIHDCRALLVSGVGPTPQAILRQRNIRLVIMEGLIEPAARSVFQGEEVRAPVVAFKCGARCEGDGKGCA